MSSKPAHIDHPARSVANDPSLRDTGAERLVFFSDAVIAIAITLLVLDIRVPRVEELLTEQTSLVRALLNQWPSYVSYVISFVIIEETWANHHMMFAYIKRTDYGLLLFSILLLLCIAFIPFSTALLAEYIEQPDRDVAAFVYGMTLTFVSVFFNLIWWYVRRHPRLLDPQLDSQRAKAMAQRYALGPILYGVAMILAFVSIPLSVGLYILLALLFAVPGFTGQGAEEHPAGQHANGDNSSRSGVRK